MKIIFLCNNIPDAQLGGIDAVSELLVSGFIQRGYVCYCAYVSGIFRHTDFFSETIQCTFDRMGEENLRAFIDRNQIDILINQRPYEYGNIEFLHRSLQNTLCKIITIYHSKPGWETYCLKEWIPTETFKQRLKHIFYPLYYYYTRKRVRQTNLNGCRFSDAYVLLSANFKPDFLKSYRIPDKIQDKIIAIPNALRYPEILAPEALSDKHKIVLIVSRFDEHQKRLSLALKIWQQIEESGVGDWKLVIVGHGPDEKLYRQLAEKLNLKNISFEGRQEPLPYYKKASLFMMTSAYEGWGMTLTEAQQMGVVPIAYNSYSALQDIITDKYDGLIIPDGHEREYVNGLIRLIEDNELRRKMAVQALNSSQRFTKETIIEQWIQLFDNLKIY